MLRNSGQYIVRDGPGWNPSSIGGSDHSNMGEIPREVGANTAHDNLLDTEVYTIIFTLSRSKSRILFGLDKIMNHLIDSD